MQILLFITGLISAPSLLANEKVFYCQQKASAGVSKRGVDKFVNERFKLRVTPQTITFGKSFGFLPGETIPFNIGKEGFASFYYGPNDWSVISFTDHISMFDDGTLLFLQNYRFEGLAVFAVCEGF
jgi:hypothetical protein